jgi:hypothetical protein
VILTVCSAKGSPGVTTLASVLASAWPGQQRPMLLEADPAGGDLGMRLRTPQGNWLARDPGLPGLLIAAREGLAPERLPSFAQPTGLGFAAITAPWASEQALASVAGGWPRLAETAAAWPGLVIADAGRVTAASVSSEQTAERTAGHTALLRYSTVVLILTSGHTEGFLHAQERAGWLAGALGPGPSRQLRVAAAVRCRGGASGGATMIGELRAALNSPHAPPAARTVRVCGHVAEDTTTAGSLRDGAIPKRMDRTDLLRTGRAVADELIGFHPELATVGQPAPPAPTVPAGHPGRPGAPNGAASDHGQVSGVDTGVSGPTVALSQPNGAGDGTTPSPGDGRVGGERW